MLWLRAGRIRHADRFANAERLLTVAAFAVCSQSNCHPIVSKLPSAVICLVCAWLIANAHVVDMQNDFIDAALGTAEAVAIVPAVKEKILSYPPENVIATMDTHGEDYMDTQEGKNLPVVHCIKGTDGWQIRPDIAELLTKAKIYEKPTFGSIALASDLKAMSEEEEIELELIGLCTDICVVSNALLLKASMPEVQISVDAACCAGVTPEKHLAALETMRSCQIQVKNG